MSQHPFAEVDERRLETDILYRFRYVSHFVGFGEADIDLIETAGTALDPHLDAIVHDVYHKLFQHDATLRHFIHRQHGLDAEHETDVRELSLSHVQIRFRMTHLAAYLRKLVTGPYDERLIGYLDFVARMHTPKAGNPMIHVPPVQMTAMMGYLAGRIYDVIHRVTLTGEQRLGLVHAFNKLFWVQHDLMMHHQMTLPRPEF